MFSKSFILEVIKNTKNESRSFCFAFIYSDILSLTQNRNCDLFSGSEF